MKIVRRKKLKQRKLLFPYLKFFIILFICLFGYLFIYFTSPNWNGEDKVIYVQQKVDGDVATRVIDPKLNEITTLIIPGDTEVSVARNLGTLRIKNVWQLGVNEGVGGNLLAQTVSKNFLFPVFLWKDEKSGKTNVPLGDRLFLKIFEIRTRDLNKTEIDLGKSQFVKKVKLTDGEAGYKIPGEISERLTAYFSDNLFSQKIVKVYIRDATGSFGKAETVGRTLEVMGGKVVTLEKLPAADSDCLVLGENKEIVTKVAKIFSCKKEIGTADFDLVITLGSAFAKRF